MGRCGGGCAAGGRWTGALYICICSYPGDDPGGVVYRGVTLHLRVDVGGGDVTAGAGYHHQLVPLLQAHHAHRAGCPHLHIIFEVQCSSESGW